MAAFIAGEPKPWVTKPNWLRLRNMESGRLLLGNLVLGQGSCARISCSSFVNCLQKRENNVNQTSSSCLLSHDIIQRMNEFKCDLHLFIQEAILRSSYLNFGINFVLIPVCLFRALSVSHFFLACVKYFVFRSMKNTKRNAKQKARASRCVDKYWPNIPKNFV